MKLSGNVKSVDCLQQTLAMLRILTLEDRWIEEGKFFPLDAAFGKIEKHIEELR